MLGKILNSLLNDESVVHHGYSATEWQIGTIYEGYIVTARLKIPRILRWLYDGRTWEFLGRKARSFW